MVKVRGLTGSKNVVDLRYRKTTAPRTYSKPNSNKKIDDQVSNYSEKNDKGRDAPTFSQLGGRLFENRMQRSTSNEAYVRGDFNSSSYNKKYANDGKTNSARKVDKGEADVLGKYAPSVREFTKEKSKTYTPNETRTKSPTAKSALKKMGY